ncbi:glycosyl transferase [Nocardioides baekrokdamisoli]|uniref:Glycosyl transferase n=1 Tax=Nocardioides baekrokdamisoli TaxID=1804624 RepID=A0A3G9IGN1_9ACTN|nr:glycosyltransferase family 39 protein [Nocardioides baekrokdamisoli]BBH18167.1 glycosyl transferase [Nocardioides baekrokdamisoli]
MPEDPAPTRLSQRVRDRLPIAAVLTGSLVLYTWNLAVNQWGNTYYSAAVWAGSRNLEAAFFGSIDPHNAMSVDKPPAAFWLPEILVRIFGLHSWTLMLPNALLGVATVGMVYLIVRRVATERAAVFGAIVTALTPAAALMFRYNNPDALLVFLLVTAGYATIRAIETGARRWLITAGLLVGFGVLTKMLQAGLVVPVFALAHLDLAPGTVKRRLVDLLWAAAAIIVGCGWWFAIVALTPAGHRPFIDGTTNNSIIDLVFGYNGFGRLTGGSGNEGASNGLISMFRLTGRNALPMVSWLVPAAVLLGLVALVKVRRRPRTDPLKAVLLIAAGSMVISIMFFILMGGIYHDYYMVAVVPWLAITIAVAAPVAGRRAVATAAAVSAAWAYHILQRAPMTDYRVLGWLLLVAGLGVAAVVLIGRGRVAAGAMVAAAVLAVVGPAAYALRIPAHGYAGSNAVVTPSIGMDIALDRPEMMTTHCPKVFGGASLPIPGFGQAPSIPAATAQVLRSDTGSRPWVAATVGSERAASYELASGKSVMGVGGYKIRTPGISLAAFQNLVKHGQVRYFLPVCVWPVDETTYLISVWVWQHYAPTTVAGIPVIDFTKPRTKAS